MSTPPVTVAVVPAKGHSGRVPKKNFRPFIGDQSLLEIKIGQLKRCSSLNAIYVSSDSDEAEAIAERCGVNFLRRIPELSGDDAPWSDVLCGILEQAPVGEETFIAWSPVTSPLFTAYDKAVAMLGEDGADSVMTVTRLQHYYLNGDMLPLNYQWGVWASYSQLLKPIYQMNCALWLARKKDMIRNRFQIGDKPTFLHCDAVEGIDIDTMDEFDMAQFFYDRRFVKASK